MAEGERLFERYKFGGDAVCFLLVGLILLSESLQHRCLDLELLCQLSRHESLNLFELKNIRNLGKSTPKIFIYSTGLKTLTIVCKSLN